MYGTQSEILIYGNGTFFLFDSIFIAQSKNFALLFVSSLCLLANDSRNVLLLTCSLVIRRKLAYIVPYYSTSIGPFFLIQLSILHLFSVKHPPYSGPFF